MAKRNVKSAVRLVTGALSRIGPLELSAYREVSVGSHRFTVPLEAVPAVPDGTVVAVELDVQGQPVMWELPRRKEAAALGIELGVWQAFKAGQAAPLGLWGTSLFESVFSLPVLVHANVDKMLGSDAHTPPYEDLSQYPCVSDGQALQRARRAMMIDPVLGAYLERFGWATAHLRLRYQYGLDRAQAHQLLKCMDLSLNWLTLYPYLGAYALEGFRIPFEVLDAIAYHHQRMQSRPERLHAALVWTMHHESLTGAQRLVRPVREWIALTDRALNRFARQSQTTGVSAQGALQQTVWPDLIQTQYVHEWGAPNGDQMAAVTSFWSAVYGSGRYLRQRVNMPPTVPLIPAAARSTALMGGLDPDQQQALDAILQQRLTLVTGGPGRGKTRLIATLAVLAAQQPSPVPLWVLAPTARAAVVSKHEALALAKQHGVSRDVLFRTVKFMTVHRALALTPTTVGARTPGVITPPLVLVDETSMLDAMLLHALLRSARDSDTRLALIGDAHQLPPVGVGQPLLDVLAFLRSGAFAYPPGLIHELTTMHRTNNNPLDPAVEDLRDAIDEAAQRAATGGDPDQIRAANAARYQQALDLLDQASTVQHKKVKIRAAQMVHEVERAIAKANKKSRTDFYVLTTYRIARMINTTNLNQALHDLLHPGPDLAAGEPVVVRRNGHYPSLTSAVPVYVANGTAGVVVAGGTKREFVARVDDPESPTSQQDILLARAGRDIEFDLAYVDTVHAAQGGEAPFIVILGEPTDADTDDTYRMQWSPRHLYTALTRVRDLGKAAGQVLILGAITGEMLATSHVAAPAPKAFQNGWKKG